MSKLGADTMQKITGVYDSYKTKYSNALIEEDPEKLAQKLASINKQVENKIRSSY
jgi:hypothetical protein